MKKTIFLIVATALLGACVSNGKPIKRSITDSICGGSTKGKTVTKLEYGKNDINIKWKSDVGENTEFRIVLKPKKGYEDKVVKIIGRWGRLPGGASTPFAWLNKSGKSTDFTKQTMILCVPKDDPPGKVPPGTEYKFDVDIQDIGNIDPRVNVTW